MSLGLFCSPDTCIGRTVLLNINTAYACAHSQYGSGSPAAIIMVEAISLTVLHALSWSIGAQMCMLTSSKSHFHKIAPMTLSHHFGTHPHRYECLSLENHVKHVAWVFPLRWGFRLSIHILTLAEVNKQLPTLALDKTNDIAVVLQAYYRPLATHICLLHRANSHICHAFITKCHTCSLCNSAGITR